MAAPRRFDILPPLATLGHECHSPMDLWDRARRVQDAGYDLGFERRWMPAEAVSRVLAQPPGFSRDQDLGVMGFRVRGEGWRSLGVEDGDLIVAINGYDPAVARDPAMLAPSRRPPSSLVIELRREGIPLILRVDWPTKPSRSGAHHRAVSSST
jgi:hypothetical protein